MNPLFQNTVGALVRRGQSHQSVFDARPIVVPKLSTPQGGRRRLVQSAPLVVNTQGNDPYGTDPALFTVENPSTRLHLKVAVVFRPYNAETQDVPQIGVQAWGLTLDAWDRDEFGRPMQSNNIVTAQPLPTSYESITANDQWRGRVAPPTFASGGTGLDAGEMHVIACWEPAPGWSGAEEELGQIFQACRLVVTRGIQVSNGNV